MGYAERHVVNVVTDASGDATVYTSIPVSGQIHSITLVDVDLDAGADFTITGEESGTPIMALTNKGATETWLPRVLEDDENGTALTTRCPVVIAKERIKIVVAQGGNVTSGAFHIVMV